MFLLLVATVVSPAQTRREDEPYCDEKNAKKVEITDADATILGLAIGRASLKDVQTKLGSAIVTRVSREEESDVSICYVSPADGTVLVFYSGVMGGGEDITWFALWSREAAFPHASQCTPSKMVSRGLGTQSGVRLGLTKADLERIVGKPTERGPKSVKYNYLCRKKMTEDEIKGFKTANNWDVRSDPYFDRMSWIEVRYRDSTASRIEIGEIESY
ncbi:MAG: hypothetical protein WCC22_10330 [Terriglobales bacterium]